ncbi:hypothetical protein [Haloterrigena turkmenica]|uniref:hypothetical protein n=1 Tax=Haloterrigena turkmenica TaxID=62320 RepID=UPI00067828C8|nr:hypothetical protein [Haloterrigena turkmenica]
MSDISHLEDDNFAEVNPGGDAPIGNDNSATHNGWSDPDKYYDRLEGKANEYVDELAESYIKESKADLPEDERRKKARRLATYHLQWDSAAADTLERGVVLEEEIEHEGETYIISKINPAFEADNRINSKQMKLMRELRVYNSPDGLSWTEQ